jgi:lysophospholipase L1-like esterase
LKKSLLAVVSVAVSTAFALLIAEIVVRVALPPAPGDEASAVDYIAVAQRNPGAPRLFPAGYSAQFDVRGLYRGADTVTFHVGPNRFVAPEPKTRGRYNVLFLGGSVTEGIFLQDQERWPGRLAEGAEIATYNAGMSEAGMLGQYLTAKYLSELGDRFDLVVLATNHNDSTWSRRFADIGSRYDFAGFASGLKTIFEKDFAEQRKESASPLRTFAWVRHLLRASRSTAPAPDDGGAPSLVVDAMMRAQEGKQALPLVDAGACVDATDPERLTQIATENWKTNLPHFKREMKRLLGADLLVVSEPSSFGVPSNGFYFRDLRYPVTCTTREGKAAIKSAVAVDLMRRQAAAYIDAARDADAHVFDLAAAMDPISNGPEGGELFYDVMHPTPRGAEKFAEFLRPAIEEILRRKSTQ